MSKEYADGEAETGAFAERAAPTEKIPLVDWYVAGNKAGCVADTVQVIFPTFCS